MLGSRTLELNWSPFLPTQWEAFRFVPPTRNVGVTALLGFWRSGKTEGAARCLFKGVCDNPWTPAYGREKHPTSLLVAPTFKVLQQASLPAFKAVCPPEAILRHRAAPYHDITFVNGHRMLLHSGEGELEGVEAVGCWVDEIHHPSFAANPTRYKNYLARLSDKRADAKKRMIVSGRAFSGWVRDTFDKPNDPNVLTLLLDVYANPYIDRDFLGLLLENLPAGHERYLRGQWEAHERSIYGRLFDSEQHLVDDEGDPRAPTTIGLDVGDHGAIEYGQGRDVEVVSASGVVHRDKGLLYVDEELTDGDSTEDACRRALASKWNVTKVCIDPTARRDELAAIDRVFGRDVDVIKLRRGSVFEPVEAGIVVLQRGLRDGLGNVRVRFNRRLAQHGKFGIVNGMQKYRRNDRGQPVRDNVLDHALDAGRYVACEEIPTDLVEAVKDAAP